MILRLFVRVYYYVLLLHHSPHCQQFHCCMCVCHVLLKSYLLTYLKFGRISGVDLSQNVCVRIGQNEPSDCFRLHPTSMVSKHSNNPGSSQPVQAHRKISFTFHFLTYHFYPWWCETCSQQQFWMKECDILGGQNIFLPHLHFQGSRPKPPYLRPLSIITVSGVEHISRSAIMETTQTVNTANQSSIMDDASLL